MNEKSAKILNIVSIALMAVSSLSIVFFNLADYNSEKVSVKVFSFFISLVFWLTLIGAWVLRLILYKQLKKTKEFPKKPAIITFFSNQNAKIADIAMMVTFAIMVICGFTNINNLIKLIFISLFVFAFQMHIVLNGKVNNNK